MQAPDTPYHVSYHVSDIGYLSTGIAILVLNTSIGTPAKSTVDFSADQPSTSNSIANEPALTGRAWSAQGAVALTVGSVPRRIFLKLRQFHWLFIFNNQWKWRSTLGTILRGTDPTVSATVQRPPECPPFRTHSELPGQRKRPTARSATRRPCTFHVTLHKAVGRRCAQRRRLRQFRKTDITYALDGKWALKSMHLSGFSTMPVYRQTASNPSSSLWQNMTKLGYGAFDF